MVEEELVPFTGSGTPTQAELAAAIAASLPATVEAFQRHPLGTLGRGGIGIEPEGEDRSGNAACRVPCRCRGQAGRVERDRCWPRARRSCADSWPARASSQRPEGGRAFAYKLHQFIGQGRDLDATLEPADVREFRSTASSRRAAAAVHPDQFCRQCGQDYYHVLRADDGVRPHPALNQTDNEHALHPGYLMLAPPENDWSEALIPDEWRDAKGRLRRPGRPGPTGHLGCAGRPGTPARREQTA